MQKHYKKSLTKIRICDEICVRRKFLSDKCLPNKFLSDVVDPLRVSYSSFSVNFALSKTTSQSSNDEDGKSQRLVDGGTNGQWLGNTCTETRDDTNPWFRVDLEHMISVTSVSNTFNYSK